MGAYGVATVNIYNKLTTIEIFSYFTFDKHIKLLIA